MFAALLVAAIFIGTFAFLYINSRPKPKRYETLEPKRQDLVRTTVVTGKIEPRDEVAVKPQISGIITELLKEAGQRVEAGEVIAKLKVIPDMQQLSSAESRVRLATINHNQTRTDHERQKTLFDKGLISANEYEKTRQAFDEVNTVTQASGKSITTAARQLLKYGAQENKKKKSLNMPSLLEEDPPTLFRERESQEDSDRAL